jgi:hypothetical protein
MFSNVQEQFACRSMDPVTKALFFSICIVSFGIGFLFGERNSAFLDEVASCKYAPFERSEESALTADKLMVMSAHQFSCNTELAYEELTKLHQTSARLKEHVKRGEANRDRTQTIIRKSLGAQKSEQSYRSCLEKMMPELLVVWDDDLKSGKLRKGNKWDDTKEETIGGITFKTLEETADAIES